MILIEHTLKHAPISTIGDRKNMRWVVIALLALVDLNNVICVDW